MLELKQLKKVYHRDAGAGVAAVENVELSIRKGDFISIMGRSGSGKSTLLNIIAGLLRPTSGRVLLDGVDLWSLKDKDMAKIRNSKIGYIPQGMSLLPNLSVLDNVRLPFCLSPNKGNGVENAEKLLEDMGIRNLADSYPSQLSGGEMRRASIARALVNNPEILLADEPTGDLDEETTKEVMKLFTEVHRSGITIVMVTHAYDITGFGSRLYIMSSGTLTERTVEV